MLERSNGKVVVGGKTNEENKYISPTLVVDVKVSDSIMEDEVCDSISVSSLNRPTTSYLPWSIYYIALVVHCIIYWIAVTSVVADC